MNKGLGILLTGVVAFTGGLVAGALLAPKSGKENRLWLQDNTKDAKKWVELKGSQLLEQGERRINQVSKDLKRTVKNAVPDLYEATSHLHFDDDDLEHA
ncbi:MAG: YtxH domain-containing protein [Balneolaceae bacterium]